MTKAEIERVGEACLTKNMKSSVSVLSRGFITPKITSTEMGTLTFCFLSVCFVWPASLSIKRSIQNTKVFHKGLRKVNLG